MPSSKPVGISDTFNEDAAAWSLYSDLLKPAGTRWLRFPVHWYLIEGVQGTYNWTALDLTVSRAAEAGIKLLAILLDPPQWAWQSQNFNADITAFATQLRTRYCTSIAGWEFGNEPNVAGYGWPDWNDPNIVVRAQRYAGNVAAFAAGYRPAAGKIIAGALSLANDPTGFTQAFFAACPIANFDAYSFHPYGYAAQMPALAANVKGYMQAAYGQTKEAWVTEMGSDPVNATIMQQCFGQVPQLDAFFWFSMRDLQPTGLNYGVVENDAGWSKKQPVYNSLKAYLAAA